MKPSSENTGSGPKKSNLPAPVPAPPPAPVVEEPRAGGTLIQIEEPTVVDGQVATLQGQLVEEQDARKEERFLWFAACGLLFMVMAFMAAGTVAGTIVAMVYVALLLVLSKRWGFEGLWEAMYAARDLIKGDKKDEEGGDSGDAGA